jgi:rhodanese-related sulfurtransferase
LDTPNSHQAELISGLEPISTLAPEQFAELLAEARIELVQPGSALPMPSDGGARYTVYLIEGELDLPADGRRQVLRAGTAEARHPLPTEMYSGMRALAPSMLVFIDSDVLDRLLTWSQISVPDEAVVMAEGRIITVDKAKCLRTMLRSSTFRNLPAANLEELLHRMEPIFVPAGHVVIRQGDPGDYFYMIDEGVALVTRNPDNDEDCIEIAELGEGATFGEAALLTDSPRNATVSMMTDGILLRLSREDFKKLLSQPTLQWLDLESARSRIEHGGAWIDVRLPSEYEHSHLPGALNIPMSALHRTARTLDRALHYICYCQTGQRSSAAAFVLRQHGLSASVLRDGLQKVPASLLQQ